MGEEKWGGDEGRKGSGTGGGGDASFAARVGGRAGARRFARDSAHPQEKRRYKDVPVGVLFS